MKTSKDLIKQALEKWGFPILKESENSVVFRYQMTYVQANAAGGDDTPAITIIHSGSFTADNPKEMLLGLKACNELNCELLQVKFYIDSDSDLIVASEFFYKTEADVEYLLETSLKAIILGNKKFMRKYSELEEDAKLLDELNEEE